MNFSKKIETSQGGSSNVASGDWDTYNESIWNAFDVDSTKDAKGREVKSSDVIGVLNFIADLGNQPQPPASMQSKFTVPAEGEENSPEELARLEEYPNNWFEWVDEWKEGKKTTIRKIFWNQQPQETLVLAVDFPSIPVDYALHPMVDSEDPDVKPLRIDYNGKFKNAFERQVSNEVLWKTGKFGAKDIKYKITTACGNIQEYQNDGHDLSYLVQATCNWEVVMTKNVDGDKTYYNIKIKNPTAIQDIKTRKDNYTVAEQLEDNKCDIPFTGILFDAEEDHYSKEQLQQLRHFWIEQAKRAVQIDRNEGTDRDGEWLKGVNFVDSGLGKALKKFGLLDSSTSNSSSQSNAAGKPSEPKQSAPEKKQPAKQAPSEPEADNFDDQIPF